MKNELLMICYQNKITMINLSQNCLEIEKTVTGENTGIRLCKMEAMTLERENSSLAWNISSKAILKLGMLSALCQSK